mmetsp:Transcript_25379/g.45107  ORF Transcript_25379/g.45107 Transcript_25379/m.45107 type:complete len:201 (-) Transcript_25379:278-880(-)
MRFLRCIVMYTLAASIKVMTISKYQNDNPSSGSVSESCCSHFSSFRCTLSTVPFAAVSVQFSSKNSPAQLEFVLIKCRHEWQVEILTQLERIRASCPNSLDDNDADDGVAAAAATPGNAASSKQTTACTRSIADAWAQDLCEALCAGLAAGILLSVVLNLVNAVCFGVPVVAVFIVVAIVCVLTPVVIVLLFALLFPVRV